MFITQYMKSIELLMKMSFFLWGKQKQDPKYVEVGTEKQDIYG